MPAAPPDIWSHFFLQATSNSSDDGSDSEVDAGQAERTELDDLDLGVRNEGDLVVKAANPWCIHLPSHALALQLQSDLLTCLVWTTGPKPRLRLASESSARRPTAHGP